MHVNVDELGGILERVISYVTTLKMADENATGRRKIRIACQNQMRLIRVESGC